MVKKSHSHNQYALSVGCILLFSRYFTQETRKRRQLRYAYISQNVTSSLQLIILQFCRHAVFLNQHIFLLYIAMQSGRYVPTFWSNLPTASGIHSFYADDGIRRFLSNVSNNIPDCTAPYLRRELLV